MKKYIVAFSMPTLTGAEVHTVFIEDECLEDTWSHVDIQGKVYDLNVWYDESPIQATLYPTSINKGCYTTDCLSPIGVLLHSVEKIGFLKNKSLDLRKVR